MGSRDVSPRRHEHVDDLAELVNCTVDVPPPSSDLHVGLVCEPASPNPMAAWSDSLDKQWREPLHPAVDADVVDLDATLCEELFDVSIGKAEAQVPPDRQHDDVGWEAVTGERGPRSWRRSRATSSHADSLAASRRSQRTQQRRFRTLRASSARSPDAVAAACRIRLPGTTGTAIIPREGRANRTRQGRETMRTVVGRQLRDVDVG
jgi:hypothetical protein